MIPTPFIVFWTAFFSLLTPASSESRNSTRGWTCQAVSRKDPSFCEQLKDLPGGARARDRCRLSVALVHFATNPSLEGCDKLLLHATGRRRRFSDGPKRFCSSLIQAYKTAYSPVCARAGSIKLLPFIPRSDFAYLCRTRIYLPDPRACGEIRDREIRATCVLRSIWVAAGRANEEIRCPK